MNADCVMIITKEMVIEFINKVVGEMLLDIVKLKRSLDKMVTAVQDIVDRTKFTQRKMKNCNTRS